MDAVFPIQRNQRFFDQIFMTRAALDVPQIRAQSSTVQPPARFTLIGQIVPGWQLTQAVSVVVERDEDGSYLAQDDLFLLHGVGDTIADALWDYKVALVEYYELVEVGAQDNPFDVMLLQHLTAYIQQIQ